MTTLPGEFAFDGRRLNRLLAFLFALWSVSLLLAGIIGGYPWSDTLRLAIIVPTVSTGLLWLIGRRSVHRSYVIAQDGILFRHRGRDIERISWSDVAEVRPWPLAVVTRTGRKISFHLARAEMLLARDTLLRVMHKITLFLLAFLLVPAAAHAQTDPGPDKSPPANKSGFATTAELISAALAKYFDVYCLNPAALGEFHFSWRDRLRADGVVRVILNLPDGSQRTFDTDDTLAGGHVEKTEPISGTACRLSYRRGGEQTEVFSTAHFYSGGPFTYWVWSRKHP